MKARHSVFICGRVLLCSAIFFGFPLADAFAAAKTVLARTVTAGKAATAAPSNPIPETVDTPLPQSVFAPKDGLNPFFPQSRAQKPSLKPAPDTWDVSKLILNGITSPPKATAMINGKTFEPGEAGEVKLRDGNRMSIKCIEIKAESAIIEIRGQLRELKLRSGL